MSTLSPPERRTVSLPQVAVELGLGRRTVYALARRGELPGVIRLGRRVVMRRAALDALLDGAGSPEGGQREPAEAATQ